ncbi:hypothetical protein EVC30_120 [Rhizobium phage RHph_Y1_11]|nr:hypothetical protein EVC30_120 [Rhizobium phage RHph_Y1_11]
MKLDLRRPRTPTPLTFEEPPPIAPRCATCTHWTPVTLPPRLAGRDLRFCPKAHAYTPSDSGCWAHQRSTRIILKKK